MTVFSMDPRRYRQRPTPPPQIINLVDYDVINLVDFEQRISWLPPKPMIHHGSRLIKAADDTSTIASEITQENFDQSKIQKPVCDAIMCAAETFVAPEQSRDEILLLTDGQSESLRSIEHREEPLVDFDCHDPSQLWFGCLMDAAGEAAEFLSENIVAATNLGHQKATNHFQRLEEERKTKQSQDKSNEVPSDIPEVVNLCDQEQDEIMMLPQKKKEDPPASKAESKEIFPVLEVHVPDTPAKEEKEDDNEDIHNL